MTTVTEHGSIVGFEKAIQEDPGLVSHLLMMKREMRKRFPSSLLDCIHQAHPRQKDELNETFETLKSLALLYSGRLAVASVEVGAIPSPDKEGEEQNRKLARLPHPFSANFWGGNYQEDGRISWSRPIHAQVCAGSGIEWCLLKPGGVALEVGTNPARKFWFALYMHGAVARWPYDHKRITLFVRLNQAEDYPYSGLPVYSNHPDWDAHLANAADSIDTARWIWDDWNKEMKKIVEEDQS